MEASSRLLGAPWPSSGSLLEASGGLLGACRGPPRGLFGVLGGDLKLSIILEGSNFFGGPHWCSLGVVLWVFGGHFGIIFEAFWVTVAAANSICKINVLRAFLALWDEFSRF